MKTPSWWATWWGLALFIEPLLWCVQIKLSTLVLNLFFSLHISLRPQFYRVPSVLSLVLNGPTNGNISLFEFFPAIQFHDIESHHTGGIILITLNGSVVTHVCLSASYKSSLYDSNGWCFGQCLFEVSCVFTHCHLWHSKLLYVPMLYYCILNIFWSEYHVYNLCTCYVAFVSILCQPLAVGSS